MDEHGIKELFVESGALLSGHFRLTSGLHSGSYFEKFELLQRPEMTETICTALASRFKNDSIDVVVGPAVGGILLAHETAKALGTRAIFTERVDGDMTLRRGFHINPGERVLVVEDVVTTGGSVWEVLRVVANAGGQLAGVGLLVDRTEKGADFGVKTEALYRLEVETYSEEDCPFCKEGIPLTERGSRGALKSTQNSEESREPLVGVVLGSRSDMPVAEKGLEMLKQLEIPYEVRIISAHRTPDTAHAYAKEAASRGIKVIIAGAGLAAHLAGVLAATTLLPVIGLPVKGGALAGVDALYSTVQMPPGTPVATVGIDAGLNAALLAARILAITDESIRHGLDKERQNRAEAVAADDAAVSRHS